MYVLRYMPESFLLRVFLTESPICYYHTNRLRRFFDGINFHVKLVIVETDPIVVFA